jgi:hypothetical protein
VRRVSDAAVEGRTQGQPVDISAGLPSGRPGATSLMQIPVL